ncbi:STM4015 family protein [Actinoplanes sp. HUAS TT8]|uniref:STM4015 family protein n=1 Tax=Actinoplanes sp. HUAS TT8 TaxID=3447453 RepID=UPI003F52793B
MTINEHLTTFAGLPIVEVDGEQEPDDPGAVAWRIDMEDFEADVSEFEAALEKVLERAGPGGPAALVIGEWGSSYESEFPAEFMIKNAARFSGLRALFIGEMTYEQCEISWINHNDITPLLEAFPALERLWVRGSQGLEISPGRYPALRELVLQSGGLPTSVIRAVSACDLPALEHLELWLGVSNYGGDARADDLATILGGRSLPALRHLGLCNAEIADEVAAAVAAAPVVARLGRLDLSLGTLGDVGAEALLAGQPLTHLETLDLHHHFMTAEMAQRVADELPGVTVDVSGQQNEERWGRYTVCAE